MMAGMKLILFFIILLNVQAFAGTVAECGIVNGIYENSQEELTNLQFETLAGVFSITNANTLTMSLEGKSLKALRTNMAVDRQTKMIFQIRSKDKLTRAIFVMLDRTPNQVARSRFFYGNFLMTDEIEKFTDWRALLTSKLYRYNFYCRF